MVTLESVKIDISGATARVAFTRRDRDKKSEFPPTPVTYMLKRQGGKLVAAQ